MFNVFQYDRELEQHEHKLRLRKTQSMLQERKKVNDSIHIQNYNYRVEKFLKSSLNNPVVYNTYIPPLSIVPRPSNPENFKGNRTFLIRSFKTEKERIKQSIEENSILDTQPNESCISSQSKTKHEFLLKKSSSVKPAKRLPILKADTDDDSDEKNHEDLQLGQESSFLSQNNERYPIKPNKTHFKALIHKLMKEKPVDQFYRKKDSIFGSLPAGTLDPIINIIQNSNTRFKHLFQPVSMKVLEASNIIRPKIKKKFLKKGQGHMWIHQPVLDKYD